MRGWAVLLGLALGCQCRSEDTGRRGSWSPGLAPLPSSAAAPTVPPPPPRPAPPFIGTTSASERRHSPRAAARLADVRAARHEGYVRVVLEFRDELPSYRIRYVAPPVRKCGSGDPTAIAGDARLEVQLSPAEAHDERGAPTIRERERLLELGVLKELELTCDFEAETTWVLGLASQRPYRVLELARPARIAIDVLE